MEHSERLELSAGDYGSEQEYKQAHSSTACGLEMSAMHCANNWSHLFGEERTDVPMICFRNKETILDVLLHTDVAEGKVDSVRERYTLSGLFLTPYGSSAHTT